MEDPLETRKKKVKDEIESELGVSSMWLPQRRLKVWRETHPLGEYQPHRREEFALPLTPEDLDFPADDNFFDPLIAVLAELALESPLANVGEAFRSNLTAARSLLMLPVTLSVWTAAVAEVRKSVAKMVEDFKNISKEVESGALSGDQTLEKISGVVTPFAALLNMETKQIGNVDDLFIRLVSIAVLKAPGYEGALEILFAQTLVLVWSAFEVLANDLLMAVVNADPSLAGRFLKLKRFDQVKFDLDRLAEYDFDLSHDLGSYIGRQLKIDNVETMKSIFPLLFKHEEANLSRMLKDTALRLLSKRRNLIVHRRGIVDRLYREETSEKLALGDTLLITPKDVRASLYTVRDVGVALLRAAVTRQSMAEG